MKNAKFMADNSRFGQILTDVMSSRGITGSDLVFAAGMQKGRIYHI